MKILTKEQIISLHDALIKEHGGTSELRDEGLLDSAISTPYQTFGGVDLYPSIVEKAGRFLGVAAGEVSGEELTSWLVEHITKE